MNQARLLKVQGKDPRCPFLGPKPSMNYGMQIIIIESREMGSLIILVLWELNMPPL